MDITSKSGPGTREQTVNVNACNSGDFVSSDNMLDGVLETTLTPDKAIRIELSARELEILRLIASGSTNKEIARKLYRNARTIEYHRSNIMKKLNVHTAAELIRKAITSSLL